MELRAHQSRESDKHRRHPPPNVPVATLDPNHRHLQRPEHARVARPAIHVLDSPLSTAPASAGPAHLVTGNAGDHVPVHTLLRTIQQAPSYEDFLAWLDEPSYEPGDRLLVKHGDHIVAHVQLLHRTCWFDGAKLPVGSLQDLAILPEHAQLGYDRLLLTTAEQTMRDSQAVVSLVRTELPDPFRACGWADVRAGGYSQVAVGDMLSHLSDQPAPWQRRPRALKIRLWRHIEIDALRAVYRTAAAKLWGALYRAEAYWHWLAGRKAHSELIVAVDGPDDWENLQSASRIVGYAVTRGPHVLELCCLPEFARAAPRLLVRACRDAIERDYHTISLHTPASDPLHELIVTAGGTWCANDKSSGGSLLVKLLDPARWIELMSPLIQRRLKGSGLPRPFQICFDTGHEHYRLVLSRRSSRLVADEATSADVRCDPQTFASLLVGNLNISRAHEVGRLHVDDEVLHKLAVIFPASLFWQSQFDMLHF